MRVEPLEPLSALVAQLLAQGSSKPKVAGEIPVESAISFCFYVNPKTRGEKTEAVVLSLLSNAGYTVSIPFGNARYDFIADDGKALKRIQAKTGRITGEVVAFNTSTTSCSTTKRNNKTYHGEADVFMVFCPENLQAYWVPVDSVPNKREAYLRLTASKNKQRKRVRLAADFEFSSETLSP